VEPAPAIAQAGKRSSSARDTPVAADAIGLIEEWIGEEQKDQEIHAVDHLQHGANANWFKVGVKSGQKNVRGK
jgi:hypothetical protein